jgi:tetratricopeptide (TPR) repeat protein
VVDVEFCNAQRKRRTNVQFAPPTFLLSAATAFLALAFPGCGRNAVGHAPAEARQANQRAEAELGLLRDQGGLIHLQRARALVGVARQFSPAESNLGTLAMEGRVAMASHRFGDASNWAAQLTTRAPTNAYCWETRGDSLYELGDYNLAAQAWIRMEALAPHSAGGEARTAQLCLIHGQVPEAKTHLAEALQLAAQGGPAAASGVAGCAVQFGEAQFRSGDWEGAEASYRMALKILPQGYLANEHLAELRGAQDRVAEAIQLYQGLIDRTNRPELMQDMGDLLAFTGQAAAARPWLERARDGYLSSIALGEVLYLHHLSGLYADSLNDPEPAVEWARKDLAYRHTIQAYDSLAWALTKAGRLAEAQQYCDQALATGTKDPHLLYHAAMLQMSAGRIAAGKTLLLRATESNPRFNAFHVHR